jgi:subtilisin family serine protease
MSFSEGRGPTAQQNQQVIALHTSEDIKKAYQAMLDAIDFHLESASRYGRANDVPILVVETKADCQHPAFFGSDEHAFDMSGCISPESTSESIVIDWSETEKRHGTCVSSIIGAKGGLYGPALAAGANLRLSASGTIDTSSVAQMYQDSLRPFVVNISSVVSDVGAEASWKTLLANGISKYAVFVAAAGNDNALLSAKNEYPAVLADTFPNVISVGALDQTGLWVWEEPGKVQGSNSGSSVEVLAPGAEVPCATEVLDEKAVYTIAPGTSFAAPLVSAAAALLLEKGLTPIEVKARLLSTAVPLERQRSGEPLARYGRLSISRALLDLNSSHFEYPQDGSKHLDNANTPTQDTEVKYRRQDDVLQKWLSLPLSDVLSIDLMPGEDGKNNLYRIVRFSTDSPGRTVLIEKVLLQGCCPTIKKATGVKYLVIFGTACGLLGNVPSEHWISNPKTFIAPRAGFDKFQ